jgi:nicotinamidase-related amidase
MKSAIILIDIQNDYFKGGRNELFQSERASENAGRAMDYYRSSGMPVYHVQHISTREGATFFLPDTEGVEIHDSVRPMTGEQVFVKNVPNAFFNTGLADELIHKNIGKITICGMMSHMCIDTTVRAAREFGFKVTVLHDACATKDLVWEQTVIPAEMVHKAFMASLQGVFANVISTDEFIKNA